ncbi:MAG: glycosyltransferase [Terracidiphilus sp.]
MSPLNIACYYPWIYLSSGVERTIVEVAMRSRHRWTIYTNHLSPEATYQEFSKLKVVELDRVSVNRGYLHVGEAALKIFRQRIPMHQHDVLLVHSEGAGDFVTFRNHSKPVVCYCHTPLKVINDPWARRQYLRRNPGKAPLLWLCGTVFQFMDRLAWRKYSRVLANSESVRERIARARLAPAENVEVLNPGVDCTLLTPTWTYEKYFLLLARLKWWKNVELAIEGFRAFRRMCSGGSEFTLVVAGQVDEGSRKYYSELQNLAASCQGISFVPNPSAEKIRSLYRSCYAVLNTTLNEDWGIVPLEANAYGKPVIAVNQGGPLESQVHGKTGYLVPPEPAAFAAAMASLAEDERLVRTMGEQARLHVSKYDWSNFVARIDEVLEEVARKALRGSSTSDPGV